MTEDANNIDPIVTVQGDAHPTLSDITLALARLADRVADSNAVGVEPYVHNTMRRALQELELGIPGFDLVAPEGHTGSVNPSLQDEDVVYQLESAERYLIAARAALTRGQDREALVRALRGLSCRPHNPQLWFAAAKACFELGAIEDSLRCLYHTLWIHDGYQEARNMIEEIVAFLEEKDDSES